MLTIDINRPPINMWHSDLKNMPRGMWVAVGSRYEQEKESIYYCYRTPEVHMQCDFMIVAFVGESTRQPEWVIRDLNTWRDTKRQWRYLNQNEHIELVLRGGKSWEAPKVSKC